MVEDIFTQRHITPRGDPVKKWLLSYMKRYSILVTVTVILVIISAGVDVLPPFITKKAIDSYILNTTLDTTQRVAGVTKEALIFLGIVISSFVLNFLTLYISSYTGAKIIYDLRRDVFDHVLHLPMSYFDKTHSGVVTTRITNDTQNLMEYFVTVFTSLVKDVFLIAGIFFMLVKLSTHLLETLSPVMLMVVIVTVVFRRYARKIYDTIRTNIAKINAFLAEHIAGMTVIQAFEVRDVKRKEFMDITEEYYGNVMKQITLFGIFRPSMDLLYSLGIAIIVWFGSGMVKNGLVGIGTLYAFASYLDMFFNPIRDFAEKFDIAQSSLASAEKIEKVLENDREEFREGGIKEIREGVVEFRDVWLAYEGENWVLKGINAKFEPGGLNAIVGETGAGKTSMLSLLNLTYRPQKGEITIDGIDIRKYDLKALRKQISVVPQEVIIFEGTILDNIRLFDKRIPKDRVIEALRKIRALEVFEKFPEGIDTYLTERGGNLSLGERQLISLARAVLFDAKVLILDEATASIDTATESLIQETIDELAKEKAVIAIAHRLSTVKNAKKIYVLHEGKIIEEGNHFELLKRRGFYYRLYSKMREGNEGGKTEIGSDRSGKNSK